jgi:hypothetical protein
MRISTNANAPVPNRNPRSFFSTRLARC